MEWREAPEEELGRIYNFRRGYRLRDVGKHETSDQYAVFNQYLRLNGNRKFIELAKISQICSSTIAAWAEKFNWEKRAAAWDKDQMAIVWKEADRLKRNAHRESIIEFRNTAEKQARLMSRVSEDLVRVLGKRIQLAEETGEEIPLAMVSGLMKAAASISEQSRQAWASSLGITEMMQVVDTEIEKVTIEEIESGDPYDFEIEE